MTRRVALAIAIAVTSMIGCAACGSARDATRPAGDGSARLRPVGAVRPGHHLLMVADRQGVVAVDGANGRAAFRAPYGAAAPDASTIVQAAPIVAGTRVVASNPRTGAVQWSHDVRGQRRVRVVSPR